ncbi:MAG: phage GP46 family protein [Nitrosomonadales bacterium]|nr:phage GP46 family protein [Nitrosomonadales bacterium]
MDALIDSSTRDYTLSNGAALRDPAGGLSNSCYLRLSVPLGSYWPDKNFGSRLHELQREKDVARVAMLARQYAEQALAPILADGRATQINVSTERAAGRLNLLIEVTESSGETLTFKHPVGII